MLRVCLGCGVYQTVLTHQASLGRTAAERQQGGHCVGTVRCLMAVAIVFARADISLRQGAVGTGQSGLGAVRVDSGGSARQPV